MPLVDGWKDGLKYAVNQVSAELTYGFSTFGNFFMNDFLPTLITGFGAWCGGMEYDYITD